MKKYNHVNHSIRALFKPEYIRSIISQNNKNMSYEQQNIMSDTIRGITTIKLTLQKIKKLAEHFLRLSIQSTAKLFEHLR